MSNVVDLASRRTAPAACCPGHILGALLERLDTAAPAELLIPADQLERVIDDVRASVRQALAHTSERSAKP